MKMIFAAAATIALTAPAFANGLSQTSAPFSFSPVNGTAGAISTTAINGTAASGSLSVQTTAGMTALLTIAAATNSSSGTK